MLEAARADAIGAGAHTLIAKVAVMQGRLHARLGDARDCEAALALPPEPLSAPTPPAIRTGSPAPTRHTCSASSASASSILVDQPEPSGTCDCRWTATAPPMSGAEPWAPPCSPAHSPTRAKSTRHRRSGSRRSAWPPR
jgi:hypothetical protein